MQPGSIVYFGTNGPHSGHHADVICGGFYGYEERLAVAEKCGIKNGDVAMNLRVALSGRTNTPDLYSIMSVMGGVRVVKRIEGSIK